jgi:two-component system phosphate regulon sensor histidine kinase PhoR
LPKNRQKEYFAKINNEIDQMANIVGELLKLSGIERENYRDSFVTVDINILIANVSQTFADIIKKKLINIELNLAPSSLIISCNEYHIREVISNLIDNATKFTSEFGTITLTTKLSDHFVIIRCDDTGIGIAQEDIPHIFERFYKVDKSRSNAGTGLGLSITKHILDNHHASIEVNSSLNNGSAFIITLPLSESNIIS